MCNVILPASDGRFWMMGVTSGGVLTTTLINQSFAFIQGPILNSGVRNWKLTAGGAGQIIVTQVAANPLQSSLPYIPMSSLSGVNYKAIILEPQGLLGTQSTSTKLQDFIPYSPDVSMSRWPDSIGVFCARCGNATVSVSADFSCWCCACNSFVPPEETNIIVVLDE